jgi:hypothetical protein
VTRTPIGELSGITQSCIVALTRDGIICVDDLLRRDVEHVAYLVDSMEMARDLMAEAERIVEATKPEPEPVALQEDCDVEAEPEEPKRPLLLDTLELLTQLGSDLLSPDPSVSLAQRLRTIGLVLGVGGSQTEALTSFMLGAVGEDTPLVEPEEIAPRFGDDVAALCDECNRVLGVPMSPTGGSQSSYFRTVSQASAEARLVCAAHSAASVHVIIDLARREGDAVWRRFPGGREITLWYYRAIRDALDAAGDITFVAELDSAVENLEQLQTSKATAA